MIIIKIMNKDGGRRLLEVIDVYGIDYGFTVYPSPNTLNYMHANVQLCHSTSYTTSVLTSFTTIQRFPETPISNL